MIKLDRNACPAVSCGVPFGLSKYAASQGLELDPMPWDTLVAPCSHQPRAKTLQTRHENALAPPGQHC